MPTTFDWLQLPLALTQPDAAPGGSANLLTAPGGAVSTQTDAPDGTPDAGQTGGGIPPIFLLLFGFLILWIVMQVMSSRREQKKRQALLSSVKRHDRVQTVGGILGTVVEVRDDEIILRVDESSNTKIHFARSAVQQVLKSVGDKDSDSPAPEVKAGGKKQQSASV